MTMRSPNWADGLTVVRTCRFHRVVSKCSEKFTVPHKFLKHGSFIIESGKHLGPLPIIKSVSIFVRLPIEAGIYPSSPYKLKLIFKYLK